jgi:hypothetical protein
MHTQHRHKHAQEKQEHQHQLLLPPAQNAFSPAAAAPAALLPLPLDTAQYVLPPLPPWLLLLPPLLLLPQLPPVPAQLLGGPASQPQAGLAPVQAAQQLTQPGKHWNDSIAIMTSSCEYTNLYLCLCGVVPGSNGTKLGCFRHLSAALGTPYICAGAAVCTHQL